MSSHRTCFLSACLVLMACSTQVVDEVRHNSIEPPAGFSLSCDLVASITCLGADTGCRDRAETKCTSLAATPVFAIAFTPAIGPQAVEQGLIMVGLFAVVSLYAVNGVDIAELDVSNVSSLIDLRERLLGLQSVAQLGGKFVSELVRDAIRQVELAFAAGTWTKTWSNGSTAATWESDGRSVHCNISGFDARRTCLCSEGNRDCQVTPSHLSINDYLNPCCNP